MKLDVGCGFNPQGNVNIDLYLEPRQRVRGEIDPRDIKNFILADACHLPFREVFDEAISDNVIEHLENPIQAINEIVRVSRKIYIRVPNKWGASCKRPYHIWSFTPKWWRKKLPSSKIWLSSLYLRGSRFIMSIRMIKLILDKIKGNPYLLKISLKTIIFRYDQINVIWKK